MVIQIGTELETAMVASAKRKGIPVESLALAVLRERFLPSAKRVVPRDEWERRLLASASDCGVSLPDEALTSEAMYD